MTTADRTSFIAEITFSMAVSAASRKIIQNDQPKGDSSNMPPSQKATKFCKGLRCDSNTATSPSPQWVQRHAEPDENHGGPHSTEPY